MGKTFLDKKKEKQQNKFIGREEYIESFTKNFDSLDNIFFNIYGQGGVGKSYLSKKFISIAEERNCLTAYTDESIKSLLEWMEKISAQFKDKNAELSEFDKRYKTFLQETKKLETDPEKPKGTFSGLVKTITKGAIREGKKWIPGGELVASLIDEEGLASTISDWSDFARKKINNKDEVELVLEPIKV